MGTVLYEDIDEIFVNVHSIMNLSACEAEYKRNSAVNVDRCNL